MSTEVCGDKQDVVYPHNGLLFSLLKELNAGIGYSVNKPCRHYMLSEIGHHTKRTNTVWFHLCEVLSVVQDHRGRKESGSFHGPREMGRAAVVQRVLSLVSQGQKSWRWMAAVVGNTRKVLQVTELENG